MIKRNLIWIAAVLAGIALVTLPASASPAEIASVEGQISTLETQLDATNAAYTTASAQVDALQAEYSSLLSQYGWDAKAVLRGDDSLDSNTKSELRLLSQTRAEMRRLQQQASGLRSQISTLESRLIGLKSQHVATTSAAPVTTVKTEIAPPTTEVRQTTTTVGTELAPPTTQVATTPDDGGFCELFPNSGACTSDVAPPEVAEYLNIRSASIRRLEHGRLELDFHVNCGGADSGVYDFKFTNWNSGAASSSTCSTNATRVFYGVRTPEEGTYVYIPESIEFCVEYGDLTRCRSIDTSGIRNDLIEEFTANSSARAAQDASAAANNVASAAEELARTIAAQDVKPVVIQSFTAEAIGSESLNIDASVTCTPYSRVAMQVRYNSGATTMGYFLDKECPSSGQLTTNGNSIANVPGLERGRFRTTVDLLVTQQVRVLAELPTGESYYRRVSETTATLSTGI